MDNSVKNYKIHALNVNSIARIHKRHFLAQYLEKHNPDFLLLSETCLHKRHKISFSGYECVRTDMVPGTRGTAILVKNHIKFRPFLLGFTPNLEYTAIAVKSDNSCFFIFSIYVHCNQLIDTGDIESILNAFRSDDFLLLGGDFNSKHTNWANYNCNSNGNILNSFLLNDQLFHRTKLISSSLPTRFSINSFSFIDLFLLSSNIMSNDHARTYPFESDHMAIEIYIKIPKLLTNPRISILNFNKTNWPKVNRILTSQMQENLPPINRNISESEIDIYVKQLEENTLKIVEENTPYIKIHPKYQMELNSFTMKCISEKKILRRKWHNSGRSNTLLKSFINRLTKIISQLIQIQYNKKLDNEMSHIKPGPRVFRDIRRFSGKGGYQMPLMQESVDEISSAELLASHFASIHNLSEAALTAGNECPPNALVDSLRSSHSRPITCFSDDWGADGSNTPPSAISNPFVTVKTVSAFIKSRKNQKSKGEMQISNFILKKLPYIFHFFLTIIINHCLNISYFPSCWKHATIVPVPKGCNCTSDHSQYRPISLLSSVSKILELAIKSHINEHILALKATNTYQFGFICGRSTSHAITLLSEDIHAASYRKTPTLAVTIDLHKAFDSVWLNGLIFKLNSYNFPMHIIRMILNFVSNRTFQVKFRNHLSSSFSMAAGVPQGSILGPILFNLYISDFPSYINPAIKSIFFADDIFLYISKRHIPSAIASLNRYLEVVVDYLNLWKLSINYDKSKSILFRKSDTYIPKSCKMYKTNSNVKIIVNSQILQNESNIKYLGVTLNRKLSAIPHVKRIRALANAAFGCLRNIFNNSRIPINVKTLAYRQLIRPIMLYGFVGWCHLSSNQMRSVRSLERKILYKCLPREIAFMKQNNIWKRIPRIKLFDEIGKFNRIDSVLIKNFVKFFEKLEFSDINELSSLVSVGVLRDKYNQITDKFKFKCFPPSVLYFMHLQKTIYENDLLRLYNRRYNSNELRNYVYDLIT